MNNIKYPIAFDSKGSIIRADDPDIQIHRSSKTCCGCGKPMHYVDGFVRNGNTFVNPHFRHNHNNPNCTVNNAIIAGESIYHADFKKILFDAIKRHVDNRLPLYVELICDECGEVYTNRNLLRQDIRAEIEYQNGDYRPDIALIDVNNKVYAVLEIVVSHSPENDYLNFLKSHNIKLLKFELNIEKPFDRWVNKYIGNDEILRPSSISFIDEFCNKPRCKTCGSHLQNAFMRIFKKCCWSCGGNYFCSFIYHEPERSRGMIIGDCIGPEGFTYEEIEFARSKGVIIEWRYSNTIEDYYYANVCPFCNSIHGQFFLFDEDICGEWDIAEDYYEDFPIIICPKHCGGPKPYQDDTYSPNSLDIRNIDNFVDYSDPKKILEKQQAKTRPN